MFERSFDFSENVNLIHSELDSKGKTTLLRFLRYSIGYNVPTTRKICFERCEVEARVYTEALGSINLFRSGNSKLSDECFAMMSKTYEDEQTELKTEAKNLQQEIEVQERQIENLEQFIGMMIWMS